MFNCNDKYEVGHKCLRLFMMDCVAELEENAEVGQEDITPVEGKPEISLCAVNGIVLPETMRLVGKIKNAPLSLS